MPSARHHDYASANRTQRRSIRDAAPGERCWMCDSYRARISGVAGALVQGPSRMPLCAEHVASVLSHPENMVPDRRTRRNP